MGQIKDNTAETWDSSEGLNGKFVLLMFLNQEKMMESEGYIIVSF